MRAAELTQQNLINLDHACHDPGHMLDTHNPDKPFWSVQADLILKFPGLRLT